MLPFLKNRDEGGMSGPAEVVERKPDDDGEYDMLDAIAEDLLSAVEKKDKSLLKSALSALCEHLQSMDSQQDQSMMEGI